MDATFDAAFATDIGPAKTYQTVYVTSDHPTGTTLSGSSPVTSNLAVDPIFLLGLVLAGIIIWNF